MLFGSGRSRMPPLAGRVLLLTVAVIAAADRAPPGSAQVLPGAALDSMLQRRPFDHRRHEQVSCVYCHGTGAEHRTILVRTARDCSSCHHDPARGLACTNCHASGLPNAKPIPITLKLSVWDSARARVVRFSHDIHTALDCQSCHGTAVTLARNRECASCHTEHHRPQANCTTCHQPARANAHPASVHLSCSGSGCHAPAVAPPPTLSRTLCLACHQRQTAHEPGRVCTDCHRMEHMDALSGTPQRPAVKQ